MALQEYFSYEWMTFGTSNIYYSLPLFLIACGLFLHWLSKPKLHLPPGPLGLPLVGYLPFLGKEPFKTLDHLKGKYGNVISLYLGRTNVIFLADYQAVEETLSKTATLYRPPGIFDFQPDQFGVGSINGYEWVEQRSFFLKTMRDIGLGRTTWSSLVEEELSDFTQVIASKNGQPIDIYDFLTPSIVNNIGSFVYGRRLPPGQDRDYLNSATDSVLRFFSQAGIFNYYPWICKISAKLGIGSYYASYKDMVYLNSFMRKEAEDHRNAPTDSKGNDFTTQYLETMQTKESRGEETTFNEKNLYGNMQALFVGGSDTTKSSLSWLFLAMATYPSVQEKVQEELKSVLGEKHMASWEDRQKLPYTYSVIMEGQRWRTTVPLNLARMATENIIICGYDIPKGSTIIANNWGLHNDSRYWKEPEEFIPERFLRNGGKEVNLKPESYVPFSYGKRKCPGETVALMEIFLYFTTMMKLFEVRSPSGSKPQLDGIDGLTYRPVPQKLCFISRH